MSEKSKMPSDWALADSANRLSVVCLVKICTNLTLGNPLVRLEKHLLKFLNGHWHHFFLFSTCYNFETNYESGTSLYVTLLGRINPLRI